LGAGAGAPRLGRRERGRGVAGGGGLGRRDLAALVIGAVEVERHAEQGRGLLQGVGAGPLHQILAAVLADLLHADAGARPESGDRQLARDDDEGLVLTRLGRRQGPELERLDRPVPSAPGRLVEPANDREALDIAEPAVPATLALLDGVVGERCLQRLP
jgi:hypothetical protein